MRGFHRAKSRLGRLEDDERARLARRCFERTVQATRSADVGTPLVITDDAEVADVARGLGAAVVDDRSLAASRAGAEPAFRTLLRAALEAAPTAGSYGVLMADLPLLSAAALRGAWSRLVDHDLVVCPDRHGAGTNLLIVRERRPELLRFGAQDSAQQHLRLAFARRLRVAVVQTLGLAFDVDTLADYALLSSERAARA